MYLTCKVQTLISNPNFDSASPASQTNQPKIVEERVFLLNPADVSRFVDEHLAPDVVLTFVSSPEVWE